MLRQLPLVCMVECVCSGVAPAWVLAARIEDIPKLSYFMHNMQLIDESCTCMACYCLARWLTEAAIPGKIDDCRRILAEFGRLAHEVHGSPPPHAETMQASSAGLASPAGDAQ